MPVVKLLRGGQLTLPAELRKAINLAEDDMLEAEIEDGMITLKPVVTLSPQEAKAQLKALFTQSRKAASSYSEEELEQLVSDSIEEVRKAKRQGTQR